MIEQFMFEVKPWIYATERGGIEKVLHVKIQINGEEHHVERMLPNMKPFENEIEFYSRLACEAMASKLKELEEVK